MLNFGTIQKVDRWILGIVLMLIGMGIVFIYSSSFAVGEYRFGGSEFFAVKQSQRALIALFGLIIVSQIDYKKIALFSGVYYLGAIFMLLAVFSFPAMNGAHRWISLGGISVQASEVARLALIFMLARQMSKFGDELIREQVPFAVLMGEVVFIVALIALEPDFSSSMLVAGLGFAMVFVGGAKIRHLLATAMAGGIGAFLYMAMEPYRLARITGFLHRSENAQGSAFQSNQALLAIGHGRIFGTGLGMGEQKNFYVPEPHTDFVFSVLSEELGFVGMTLLTSLFVILIYRGFRVAKYAPDRLGQLLAFGLTLLIATNFTAHTAVNLGLAPTTGIPLPFISYGGMSLIFTTISIAVILNISSQCNYSEKGKK